MPLDTQTIMDVLATIPDPEMPISIVDLGIVEDVRIDRPSGGVEVDILPTFVGCPALDMIRDDITRELGRIDDVRTIRVTFLHQPPWSVDRISEVGRDSLKAHGVTVPTCGSSDPLRAEATATLSVSAAGPVPCPFCESDNTRMESRFGPTRCRMIYYCDACRNSFEHMRRV